jgi:hypothetical protein
MEERGAPAGEMAFLTAQMLAGHTANDPCPHEVLSSRFFAATNLLREEQRARINAVISELRNDWGLPVGEDRGGFWLTDDGNG